jgi:uncharacterized membrane protein
MHWKLYAVSVVVMCVLDILYLQWNKGSFQRTLSDIQGQPLQMRIESAVACYVIMTTGLWYFVLRERRSPWTALFLGLFGNGIYTTTMYATLRRYPLPMAVTDTLWGGVRFASTTWITYALVAR